MSQAEIFNAVVGTAGHIDHGKSTIVRRLTGVDPDRLPEERDRGLTIDLGFAPFKLPSGESVGIIDVPGHERFIKNMVAGATGIDLVLLIVAADDSVMPQTREHLDIMTLLKLQRGAIVINKIDLVDDEMIELVEEEIKETVEGTFLEGAPIFKVSGETEEGIEDFKASLFELIRNLPTRSTDGVFRLPIQRVFSAKGHGTVVTGVPITGQVSTGDRLEILPLGQECRVRSLQAYKTSVDTARAGHSAAINVTDVDYRDIHRGMVAATPGYFRATDMIEAKVHALENLKQPIHNQMRVRFHSGTVEAVGTLYLLSHKTLEAGQDGFVQFRLEHPIVVAPGDRYVFRLESPMITLGGGEVLDRSRWRLKAGKEYVIDALERKEAALGSNSDYVKAYIEEDPLSLLSSSDISLRIGLEKSAMNDLIADLIESGHLQECGQGRYMSKIGLEQGRKRVCNAIEQCFQENPYRIYVSKLEVKNRTRLADEFYEALLQACAQENWIKLDKGGRLSLPTRELELNPKEQKLLEGVENSYRDGLFIPQSLDELSQANKEPKDRLVQMQDLLLDQEQLLRISTEIVLHKETVETGVSQLRELFAEEGAFSASRAKDKLNTTRKFAIPFLEYLDKRKVTRRVGNEREVISDS